jgi:citrate synthase
MDKDEVLFVVKRENLETGLRGYPVGYCTTSSVDPVKGLYYLGKPIAELAFKEPEEVIYLLYYGKEPSKGELEAFKKELIKRSVVSKELLFHIRQLPLVGHPMKLFAASILLEGMIEPTGDYREDCLNLIARIPTITAAVINHHAKWPENIVSRPELGYIENFVNMLNIPKEKNAPFIKAMKLFNILHYDHGGGNLSTFVGKAVASGLEDMYGSIASAISALAGPRHGRANQDCLEFVQGLLKELGSNATTTQLETLLRAKLDRNELVFGFGHAVLRVEDPRATIFYQFAEDFYSDHPLVKIARLLRTSAPKVLLENPKISNPYPNVDAISGVVLGASGFSYPQYIALLFGMSRVVGIARQIVYERLEARDGKGTPIIRPKYLYAADESVSG